MFELSFPEATPVTTKTLSASSLSATSSWTSPVALAPAATETVASETFGAALTDMVIVYAEELYSVPSWTLKAKVTSLSEFAAGVNLK